MISIHVWGTPEEFGEEQQQSLTEQLIDCLRGYHADHECVRVYFPSDRVKQKLGKAILVEVRGPIQAPSSGLGPQQVFSELARSVSDVAHLHFFHSDVVECTVMPDWHNVTRRRGG